ncbi:Disintegrin and metalloproteinase domain-containing protein 2 [Camelus dromedarius]|uniref:Disintegrin and metalloproteinase domain-containing protein 2 n=1 Tax=Camelus dromedarius TaxID=9838 RepID=A0A5N4CFA3_CAMDR|nr:Disintegrin and metalloproteinase domain-containing protein 2 [Camelus dromedarius]
MLCLLFLLTGLIGLQTDDKKEVSYKIVIEGKTYTVNLMQKGLLQFENVSYGIEPLEPSIGFEHVIYQVKHRNAGISLYAEKETESREMPYKIQSVEPLADVTQYIEMHVVVEKNLTKASHSSGVKFFSNCSMEDFAHFTAKSQCLQNQPRLDPSYKSAVCGNGEVEEGEQCDCGSEEECEALPQVCCNRATCQLSGNSVCDTGPCCEACAYKLSGEMCRPASNECDLPEFCNGSSASCQDDFYVQNGHPCEDNQWICLEGNCMSGAIQCTHIFGEGSSFAGQECYEDLNSKGDQSGNCGATASGYTKCEPK